MTHSRHFYFLRCTAECTSAHSNKLVDRYAYELQDILVTRSLSMMMSLICNLFLCFPAGDRFQVIEKHHVSERIYW